MLLMAGGFTDERVILAAPLLYLYQIRGSIADFHLRTLFTPTRQQSGTLAGVVLFVCLRVLLGMHIGKSFNTDQAGSHLRFNITVLQLALLLAYKGSSILVLAGAPLMAKKRPVSLLLLVGCTLPGIMGSLLVFDLTRSLAYTFILLLFCARVVAECCGTTAHRHLAAWAALVSICMPTYFIWGHAVRYFIPAVFRLPGA